MASTLLGTGDADLCDPGEVVEAGYGQLVTM